MKAAPLWPLWHPYLHRHTLTPTPLSSIPHPAEQNYDQDWTLSLMTTWNIFTLESDRISATMWCLAQLRQFKEGIPHKFAPSHDTQNKSLYLLTLKAFSRSGSLLSPSKFSSLTSSSSSSSSSSLFPVDEASSVMLTSSRGCSEPLGLWNNEKCELRALACCWLHCYRPIMSRHYCWQPPEL